MPKGCHQDNCPAAGHCGEGGKMAWVGQKEAKVSLPPPSLPPLTQQHQGSEHDLESLTGSLCLSCWTDLHLHPGSSTPAQGPSGIPPVLTQVPSRAGKALQSTQERSGCWGPELCPSAASRSGPPQSAWPIHLPAAMAAMPPPGIEL